MDIRPYHRTHAGRRAQRGLGRRVGGVGEEQGETNLQVRVSDTVPHRLAVDRDCVRGAAGAGQDGAEE